MVRQLYEWSCGPHALRHLLRVHYGIKVPERGLIALCGATKDRGTNPRMLVVVLETFVEKATWQRPSYSTLREHLPALVNFQWIGDGHWGVATRPIMGEGGLAVYDPWSGQDAYIPRRAFIDMWYSKRYGSRNAIWVVKR